jgi:hypothetical protein
VTTDWNIQREMLPTYCEAPHPVRLGRDTEHYQGEPFERRMAINDGAKGYKCPGGCEHSYSIWVVYDANDDRARTEACDTYQEAVRLRDRLRKEEP